MTYALSRAVNRPFDETLKTARDALADQGFGVLTEIDLAGTLKNKIGAEVEPQVILGACRPPLAHAAVQAEPSIGLLLPCNVVVRQVGDDQCVVEAIDPSVLVSMTGNTALEDVATEARQRLTAALDAVAA